MMKHKLIASAAALLLASLSQVQAQTPIAQWTFDNIAVASYVPNPIPSINNSVGAVSVAGLGMTGYTTGTNDPDVLLGVTGDTGANGNTNYTRVWRVRGQKSGNGWSSTAPIGAQGAQFSVDTSAFTGIQVAFDWYATTQGDANLQLQYTTDGTTWHNVAITIPNAAAQGLALVDNTSGSDANSVPGFYVSDNVLINGSPAGQGWFTNLNASITDPAAANNPQFAIRLVNASTGASCVSTAGTPLNNTSGNWRFDNVIISGTGSSAISPPVITNSLVATVDGPFTNTFPDNPTWRAKIGGIRVNNTTLATSAYAISAGKIVYTPSASALLQTAGSLTITISSTNYSTDLVTQPIAPGAPKKLAVTAQPIAPTGNGGTLVAQPALSVMDQYSNIATNCAATFTAAPSSGWSFGAGSGLAQVLNSGTATFTNLSAISAAAVSGATITFTASSTTNLGALPFTTTNSSAFNIPAPATTGFTRGNLAVLQEDLATKNSTFSILELSPTAANQASPVNTFPISATGTNAMRESSSGSTGRLADSDDGTLVCFGAFLDGNSATADETTIDPRGAGTLNAAGAFVLQAQYVGLGDATANQVRSAVSVDNITWYMGDKGGVYTNNQFNPNNPYIGGADSNVRSLKSFGGTVYALQQAGGTQPTVLLLAEIYDLNGAEELYPVDGFPVDGNVLDFHMVQSGQNGSMYDTMYYIDPTNTTSGAIFKYYFSGYDDNGLPAFSPAGSWLTPNGGDGLCAATNAAGGVDLYYTTGTGGTAGNSVVMVHDSAPWNQPINLTATNLLYTVGAQATLKGIAFTPNPILATNVAFNPNTASVLAGGTTNLAGAVQIAPTNATYATVTWHSDNPAVATVNAVGLVTGVAGGTAHVYVTTTDGSNLSATNSVTVIATVITPITFTRGSVKVTGSGASASASFSFTNASGLSFSIRATNNIAAPQPWPSLGTAVESPAGSGNYQFTDPTPATNSSLFYLISQP